MPSPFPGMDPYLEQSWRHIQRAFWKFAHSAAKRRTRGDFSDCFTPATSRSTDQQPRYVPENLAAPTPDSVIVRGSYNEFQTQT